MPLLGRHLPVAIRRKLVHKTIRGRVIGLPQVPQRTGDRRKQHEEIQFHVLAGLVQVVGAGDFRRQHLAEFCAGLLQDEVIRNHPGAVQDAVELSVLVLNAGNQLPDLSEIAQIHLPIAQPTGLRAQSV